MKMWCSHLIQLLHLVVNIFKKILLIKQVFLQPHQSAFFYQANFLATTTAD